MCGGCTSNILLIIVAGNSYGGCISYILLIIFACNSFGD